MAAATSMSRRADQSHLQLPCLLTGSWGCLGLHPLGHPSARARAVLGWRGWDPPPRSAMCRAWGGVLDLRDPQRHTSAGVQPCSRAQGDTQRQ